MPDMDGMEATRALLLHERMRAIPIIAMTANAMQSDKHACMAAGMVDHISKPVDMEQMLHTIPHHVGRDVLAADTAPIPRQCTRAHVNVAQCE